MKLPWHGQKLRAIMKMMRLWTCTKDSNGNVLQTGDTIVLIKSLDVKGSTLNAKMGTVVKNIRLVPENTEQIEGKIEGQLIVILTKYVRKQND